MSHFTNSFKSSYRGWSPVWEAHVVGIVNFVALDNNIVLVERWIISRHYENYLFLLDLPAFAMQHMQEKTRSNQKDKAVKFAGAGNIWGAFWYLLHMIQQIKIVNNNWAILDGAGKNSF